MGTFRSLTFWSNLEFFTAYKPSFRSFKKRQYKTSIKLEAH